jgi:hypothetical protein
MTTSVRIDHEGPEHHNVCVRVLEGGNVVHTCEVEPGGTSSAIYVYAGRTIEISEAPQPNAPKPAP